MSRQAVEQLMDKWMNEEPFREEVRSDAETAIRNTGLELDADEWEAVKNMEWDAPDEELMTRANKLAG